MIARSFLASLVCVASAASLAIAEEKPPATAAEPKAEGDKKPPEKKPDDKVKEEKPKETRGTVMIAGAEVKYLAKTGMLPLLKDDGSGEKARVFFVYYAATDADGNPRAQKEGAQRPITYCFNGGPGASAVWLHFGGLGPRKVEFDAQGLEPRVRGPVVPNPQSILDVTDLVFIDPVGTGASRPSKGEKGEQFWSVNGDIESVGEFIRSFTTREQRWASPKFLCGESYGGVRGAGLCDFLQSKHGLYIDGFLCVSGVLNFATLGSELPGPLCFLPAFTAAAHFHGKLPPDLQADRAKAIAEAREFAQGAYASALIRGASLPAAERTQIAAKLARLTGLDETLIARARLQIAPSLFYENLLGKEGKIIGRFDGRVTSEDSDQLRNSPEFDPSYTNIYGSFSAAANASIRGDLGYEWELPYRILGGVNWSFKEFEGEEVNVEDRLARAMKTNPKLRVLFCLGWRDLAVPPDSALYSIDHLEIPDSLRKNIAIEYYESGHMMYLYQPDAEKLRRDMVRFIEKK